MAETNASPTKQEVLLIRNDLESFMPDNGRTIDSYIADALAECKRILEDERGVIWTQVYNTTDDEYLDNSDSTGRNEDRIKNAQSHMTAALIFRDYSIKFEDDDSWTELAIYHEGIVTKRLLDSVLDIDTDKSGTIEEGEEGQTGQTFFVK
jgi:hypothetical protein